MKLTKSSKSDEKIEMQMTPMIDMVFQLLIYFLVTFKISVQEGEFNIKMPKAASSGPPDPVQLPPFAITLRADDAGNLRSLSTPSQNLTVSDRNSARVAFAQLLGEVKDFCGQGNDANAFKEKLEAKISADPNLHYRYIISTITNVSGYRDRDGQIVRLIQNIQFEPPKE